MISIVPDPTNPDRLVLTQVVTIYLDKLLQDVLSEEIAAAIREQAVRDLKHSKSVRKTIAEAATNMLLRMLGVNRHPPEAKSNVSLARVQGIPSEGIENN